MRTIKLPNQRSVTMGEYVRSWRALQAMDPDKAVANFDYFPMTARGILNELRFGLQDRINRHIPGYGKGRKWDADWQRHVYQTAIAVNTPRLIVRWIPKDLEQRLAHRVSRGEDA